jgi:hypothetical protein
VRLLRDALEKRLNKLDGVSATVNYATEKATVTVPSGYEARALIDAVHESGYTAALPQPPAPLTRNTPVETEADDPELRSLRNRLAGALVLAIPVILMAMIPALQFRNWQWASLALAAPVIVWAGWPFHQAAWTNLKHGTATMDTLVSVGVRLQRRRDPAGRARSAQPDAGRCRDGVLQRVRRRQQPAAALVHQRSQVTCDPHHNTQGRAGATRRGHLQSSTR